MQGQLEGQPTEHGQPEGQLMAQGQPEGQNSCSAQAEARDAEAKKYFLRSILFIILIFY